MHMRPCPAIVSIGIAARNEEKIIRQMLDSVRIAAAKIPLSSEVEVLIGVNNSTDNTEAIVADFIHHRNKKSDKSRPVNWRLFNTPAGQINTQRELYKHSRATEGMIFLSADIKLKPECLASLLQALDGPIQITWARTIPADHRHPSFRTLAYNFVDYYPNVVKRGWHFSGRAFALKKYHVPLMSKTVRQEDIASRFWDFLGLAAGPQLDDLYISRSLITKHGIEAVVQPSDAVVYFQPLASLREFYLSQRRKEYEGHRVDLLFPEFNTFRKRTGKKTIDKQAYAKLPLKLRFACRLYMFLYTYLYKLAGLEYKVKTGLLQAGVPLRPAMWWPSLATTKQAFKSEDRGK